MAAEKEDAMLSARETGLRLVMAAAGAGSVVFACRADDVVARLLAVLSSVVFLGTFAGLLVVDVREWLGQPLPEPDPTGRPRAAEWVFVVVFDSVVAGLGCVGFLDLRRGGSGELLASAVVISVMALFLNIQFLGRWLRHRRTPD